MTARRRAIVMALVVGACAVLGRGTAAERPVDPCSVQGVERVVAVGDVHGAYDRFLAILRTAGVVDARGRWTGGRTHLVQVGDVVDRGPDSRKAWELLRRLEGEAAKAGGRVHALLGNHEVMWMSGDMRYTTPGEYASFRTDRSQELRDRFYESLVEQRQKKAKAEGQSFDEKAFREQFQKEVPLGALELRSELGPEGQYGRWLREHAAVAQIDGVVFLHGGISPATAPLGCAGLNEAVQGEIASDLEKIRADPKGAMASREDGPLWYRGLVQENEAALSSQVDEILSKLGARAIVVGHTVTPDWRILSRFNGRVFAIDTGMQPAYQPNGRASALEIKGGRFTAIYEDGRQILAGAERPAASSLSKAAMPTTIQ
jgi:Calcineurin-like phosphoesterase